MTMNLKQTEQGLRLKVGYLAISLALAVTMTFSAAGNTPSRLEKFSAMRYGIFIHNVYKLTVAPEGVNYNTPDEFANLFDVNGFANQMESAGVEYVYFTAWHYNMVLLGPNATLDKWLPGHTTKRDLVGELADALNAKGIALVIYAHPNDGHDFSPEEQTKVGYIKYDKANPQPIPVFNDFINEVYAELADRYNEKPNVLGFWWDSWKENGERIDGKRLRATVAAKFPGAIVLSNNFDKECIDLFSAERNYKQDAGDIEQLFVCASNQTFPSAGGWWNGSLKARCTFSPETLFKFTVLNAGTGAPGGVCWAVSPLADGTTWGSNNQPLNALIKANQYLKPIRETVCGVAPSKNWLVPDQATFSKAPAFTATRSLDGKKEYIHVLKAPSGKCIELPAPTESFKAATFFKNAKPVKLETGAESLKLTLGEGDTWDALDTVIVLEVEG